MFTSVRARLGLLFVAFLGLVLASVTVTFAVVASQRDDALLINLAGRQRMLSQQMTWLALTAPGSQALGDASTHFADTLDALQAGGATRDLDGRPVLLPAPDDATVKAALAEARATWERFDAQLARDGGATGNALAETSTALLAHLDVVVTRLAAQAEAKVQRLQAIQAIFLVLALLLLWGGYRVTRRQVVDPLAALGSAAQQMAAGDLETHVPTFATDEFHRLATAFEAMRGQVMASQRHLEARVRQRTQELTTAFEFSQEIAAQLELSRLLDSVTDRARALMAGSAAALCLLDEAGVDLRLAASSGNGDPNPNLRQPVSEPVPSQVVGAGRTVLTPTACSSCGFLRSVPGGQCVATPLHAGEATLGALCVVRPETATFEREEQAALALLANAAAVAIVNARLVAAGRIQAELSASQAERERLAAELHDNLAQTLSFLSLNAEQLELSIAAGDEAAATMVLAAMRGATTRAYSQVRAALTGLSATPSGAPRLADDLRACVAEVQATTGMAIQLALENDDGALAVSPLAHQQTLHIVREALLNVWRHAGATQVTMTAAPLGDQVQVVVRDDGCGFDPDAVDATAHLGLAIMRARAERSGGRLVVDSRPGAGTTVTVLFQGYREQPAAMTTQMSAGG